MAGNEKEVSLKISAQNNASKELNSARDDMEKFQDAVKAAGTALDGHKGSPREFARAMKNAFEPLPNIAKETVGKLAASLKALDDAIADNAKNISLTQAQVKGYEEAAEAANKHAAAHRELQAEERARVSQARKDLSDLRAAERASLDEARKAAANKVKALNEASAASREALDVIESQIKAEERLAKSREKRTAVRNSEVQDAQTAREALGAERAAVEAEIRNNGRAKAIQDRKGQVDAIEAEIRALKAHRDQIRTAFYNKEDGGESARIRDSWMKNGVDYSNDPVAKTKAIMEARFAQVEAEKRIDAQIAEMSKKISEDLIPRSAQLRKEIAALNNGEDVGPTPDSERLTAIENEIKAIDKLIAAKAKSQAKDDEANAKAAAKLDALRARRDEAAAPVDQVDREIAEIRDGVKAQETAAEQRIAAQKELTDQTEKEVAERLKAMAAEAAVLKQNSKDASAALRGGKRALESLNANASRMGPERDALAAIHDRAVALQKQLTDPMAMRRAARALPEGPTTNSRGMAALTAETRRAADAQRLLNGEVKAGAAGFSSLKSYVMGLVSAYALYATATTQASKAIDAFKAKEAFQITISNTMGGDMARAGQEFDYLTSAANKYGFAITAISQEYAKMAATARGVGRSDKEIRTLFEGVLSVGRVNALSDEKMQDAFRAVTQIISKNQVMSEELKGQLAEALPGAVVGFAASQGYGPERMKEFSKALEEGRFATRDIIEYAEAELKKNADAVARAQNTFQATMARFQNTLFGARTDFAENGFMEGLAETVRELDEFFKSQDGKEYLARLGQGANLVVDALAAVAKNLDKIIAGAAVLVGLFGARKLGGLAVGLVEGFQNASKGIDATTGAATRASKAIGAVGVAGRGLLAVMGGPAGLVATLGMLAAGGVWSWMASQEAEKTAEAQSRMERIRDVIGEIRTAAVNSQGDVDKFVSALSSIKNMTGAQQTALRRDIVEAKQDVRDRVTRNYNRAKRSGDLSAEDLQVLANVSIAVNKGGDFDRTRASKDLDDLAKRVPAAQEYVLVLQDEMKAAADLEKTQESVIQSIEATNGNREAAITLQKDQTTENKNLAEAASLAAESEKKFQDAMTKARQEAGDVSGLADYDAAMKQVQDTKKSLLDTLKRWTDDQKAAGKALPVDEVARRTREIERLTSRMADTAAANLYRIQAAARGVDGAFSDMTASQLAAMDKADQQRSQQTMLGGNGSSVPKGERADYIRKGLIARGLPAHVADAFLANFQDESGLNPGAVEGKKNVHGTRGYGLYQMTDTAPGVGRRSEFERFARERGAKLDDLDVQLDFLMHELQTSEKSAAKAILATNTTADAAEVIVRKFLRPAKVHENERVARYRNLPTAPAGVADREVEILSLRELAGDNFSEAAKQALDDFAIAAPRAITQALRDAVASGASQDVVRELRAAGGDAYADRFSAASGTQDAVRGRVAATEIRKEIEDLIEGLKFDKDELGAESSRSAAIDRETASLLKKIRKDGASAAAVFGTATEADAEAAARARVEAQALLELEKQREELQRDRTKSDAQASRDAQQRIELARIENEEAKERRRIEFELLNEEQDTGLKRTDAERNALVDQQMVAWTAENGKRVAEQALTRQLANLQANAELLRQKLAVAEQDGDFDAQGRLKGEIAGVNAEVLTLLDSLEKLYQTMGGPEGEQGAINIQKMRLETQQANVELQKMSPEAQQLAGVISGHLAGAVSTFSERVAQGEDPWDALKASVAQAVGQILIDIGRMITQAIIARAVMNAMGMSPNGAPLPGGPTGFGNILGTIGNVIGGKFHSGGIAGDLSKRIDFVSGLMSLGPREVPAILERGEEVLTRRDPRHRENMGLALARIQRFHTGGVAGGMPDPVAASAAASGAATRAMTGIAAAAPAPAAAPVNIHNHFDAQSVVNEALATPVGERALLNVISKSKSKLKAMLS